MPTLNNSVVVITGSSRGFGYAMAREFLSVGACVVISSELLEIIGLCHRVIVMRSSRIVASLDGSAINEDEIMLYATGVKSPQSFSSP